MQMEQNRKRLETDEKFENSDEFLNFTLFKVAREVKLQIGTSTIGKIRLGEYDLDHLYSMKIYIQLREITHPLE